MKNQTVVIGASTNPERYSNKAIKLLREYGHPTFGISSKEGIVSDVELQTGKPKLEDIDTVSLYLSSENLKDMEDYILSLKPKRIIFNPGAENFEFMQRVKAAGIEVISACTLVMLKTDQY